MLDFAKKNVGKIADFGFQFPFKLPIKQQRNLVWMTNISQKWCLHTTNNETIIYYSYHWNNSELKQQNGWKTQDGRMKKNVARECAFPILRNIFLS